MSPDGYEGPHRKDRLKKIASLAYTCHFRSRISLCFFRIFPSGHARELISPLTCASPRVPQVRSGMAAYAGAARHCVHLATVLLWSPSVRRPGRRGCPHIAQLRLRLMQPRSTRTAPWKYPAPGFRQDRIRWAESSVHMSPHVRGGLTDAPELCAP